MYLIFFASMFEMGFLKLFFWDRQFSLIVKFNIQLQLDVS